jgi:hypothetical protein
VTGRATLLAIGIALAAGAASAEGPTIANGVAVLQGLDKVTARISPVEASLDQPTRFGNLEIIARTCLETPPTEPPESAAFLEIYELPPASEPDAPPAELFSGWMFASTPAVSALAHPVYDVWVVDCEEPIEPANDDHAGAETTRPPSE